MRILLTLVLLFVFQVQAANPEAVRAEHGMVVSRSALASGCTPISVRQCYLKNWQVHQH